MLRLAEGVVAEWEAEKIRRRAEERKAAKARRTHKRKAERKAAEARLAELVEELKAVKARRATSLGWAGLGFAVAYQAVEKPLEQAKWGFGEHAAATIPQSAPHLSSVKLRSSLRLAR